MSEIDNNTKSTIKIQLIEKSNCNQEYINSDDNKDYVNIIPINLTRRQINAINKAIIQYGKEIQFKQKR